MREAALTLGRRRAKLFIGFACFLYDQCLSSQIQLLNFCTREGVFFRTVFEALFNRDGQDLPRIRTQLLEASRLSTFAASFSTGGKPDFARLFRLYKKQSASTVLTSLGLDPKDYSDFLSKHSLEADKMHDDPSRSLELNRFLADPEVMTPIKKAVSDQRNALVKYLAGRFEGANCLGFVDIGWQGTIQDAISGLFPEKTFHGMYLGLALQRNEPGANCTKTAYGPDRNRSTGDYDLLDAVNVLEFICLSNGGSAVAYRPGPHDALVAEMRHNPDEDALVEQFSLPFQQGVLEVAMNSNPEQLLRDHRSGLLTRDALRQWRGILHEPDTALVKAYFALKSNEEFGYGSINDQSFVPSTLTVLAAPLSAEKRRQLIRYLTYSQWAEGMKARSDLPAYKRTMFYFLMQLALLYKRRIQDLKASSADART